MTDGNLNTFGAAAYSRVHPLTGLTASPAKRINDRRNSKNVGPLIALGWNLYPREEALNHRPVFRNMYLDLLSGMFAS